MLAADEALVIAFFKVGQYCNLVGIAIVTKLKAYQRPFSWKRESMGRTTLKMDSRLRENDRKVSY